MKQFNIAINMNTIIISIIVYFIYNLLTNETIENYDGDNSALELVTVSQTNDNTTVSPPTEYNPPTLSGISEEDSITVPLWTPTDMTTFYRCFGTKLIDEYKDIATKCYKEMNPKFITKVKNE